MPDFRGRMPDIRSAMDSLVRGPGKRKAWLIVISLVIVVAAIFSPLHRIDEGNVGVYYRNGALMEDFSYPGVYYMTPVITEGRFIIITSEKGKGPFLELNSESLLKSISGLSISEL